MSGKPIPSHVNTTIVGNGPSALILSFILHGNTPYYIPANPHPDPILHKRLSESPCLLDVDLHALTAHFAASRLSYSTQTLPINVLLDTLIRPLADIDPGQYRTCLEWRFEVERKVPHVVLGNTAQAGGQWADNPVSASWDIGALSYAEMLSLPGYSFEEHHKKISGASVPHFHRPTRREIAGYLAMYPQEVGIQDSVYTDVEVGDIRRVDGAFYIGSHGITCKHLILASGIFSNLIPPRPPLHPLYALPKSDSPTRAPILVVGSGFTAADVIISLPKCKVIHIFKWDPEHRPSPLRACHPRAYPEYAGVYRQMKGAVRHSSGPSRIASQSRGRKLNPGFAERDWDNLYEGLPNTYIKDVAVHGNIAHISLEKGDGTILQREISGIEYVIGRRGSLKYLSDSLATEVLDKPNQELDARPTISGRTLRSRTEASLELSPDVFAIGSLTGDSLIRFAYGGCVFAAREIMRRIEAAIVKSGNTPDHPREACLISSRPPTDQLQSRHYQLVSVNGLPDPP